MPRGTTETGRGVVPDLPPAEVVAAAVPVAAAHDVGETAPVLVDEARRRERRRVAGEPDHARDQRRGQARAADDDPPVVASEPVRVVDGEARVGICDRRHVGHRAHRTVGVLLPRRLVDPGGAPAPGAPPRGLVPDAVLRLEPGATHGDHLGPRGGELRGPEAEVTRRGDLCHARVRVVVRGEVRDAVELVAAVGVRHDVGAQSDGRVHRLADVGERGRVGLDEQDVAVGARGRDGLDVERDLHAPAGVAVRRGRAPTLVDLAEASVGGRTGRQSPRRAVDGEIGLDVGVVERVDDPDRLPGAERGVQLVGRGDVGRPVSVGRRARG